MRIYTNDSVPHTLLGNSSVRNESSEIAKDSTSCARTVLASLDLSLVLVEIWVSLEVLNIRKTGKIICRWIWMQL